MTYIAEVKRQIVGLPDNPSHICCLGHSKVNGTTEQPLLDKASVKALVASHDELLEAAKALVFCWVDEAAEEGTTLTYADSQVDDYVNETNQAEKRLWDAVARASESNGVKI